MGLGGSAGNMAAGGRGEAARGGPCEGPGLWGSYDSPPQLFRGVCTGPWACVHRGERLELCWGAQRGAGSG